MLASPTLLLSLLLTSGVDVYPSRVLLDASADRQQLLVTQLISEDGVARDLTPTATYASQDPSVVSVSSAGTMTAVGVGKTEVVVSVGDAEARVPVEVESVTRPPVSFRREIMPVLTRFGCSMGTCHGSLSGKGGFKLSLRGDDPVGDHPTLTRDLLGRRIDRNRPSESLLIKKAVAQVPHEGGRRFALGSGPYARLTRWIAEGAQSDPADTPTILGLTLTPGERYIAPGTDSQQLVATARFSDGREADVTHLCSFDISDPTVADVGLDGRVTATKPCDVAVSARYGPARATSRLTFLAANPDFVWNEPPATHFIDQALEPRLKILRIEPSPVCDDETFLRRAYLTTIGRLPTVDEARAFLRDRSGDRRDRLARDLVEMPEFAEFWSLKFADLLKNEEKQMGVKGVWAFRRWLRLAIEQDRPFDEIVCEMLTTGGSTWANPAASFHRTNRDPLVAAETTAQVFLGLRVQCAKCHNHPFDVWKQEDYYGLAAHFAGVDHALTTNYRRDQLDSHEVNGDEIILLSGKPRYQQPNGPTLDPRPLGGTAAEFATSAEALENLATELTSSRQFARNIANRVWYHLLGRGVVDAPDDFRESNPPSQPALLEALTDRFVEHDHRLRPLVVDILTSRAFQRDSMPTPSNAEADGAFARGLVELLPAEVLFDALEQAIGVEPNPNRAPDGMRRVAMAGVRGETGFLKAFGKPERLLTCDCERSEATSLEQALKLVNGVEVRERLKAKENRVARLAPTSMSPAEQLDELFLATLSRFPSEREQQELTSYLEEGPDRGDALRDVLWALINSKEFLLRR